MLWGWMKKKNKFEILLVEDNDEDAELMKEAFEEFNILEDTTVDVAKSGIEALIYLFGSLDSIDEKNPLKRRPKLTLLDLNLSKYEWLDLLKIIKSHPIAREIPIVILADSDDKTDWLDAHTLGVNSYLCKSRELGQIIEAASWAILEDTYVSYQ